MKRLAAMVPGEIEPGDVLVEMGNDIHRQRRDLAQVIGEVLAARRQEDGCFVRCNWQVRTPDGTVVEYPADGSFIGHQVYVLVPRSAAR
jgi:hypothetical protein